MSDFDLRDRLLEAVARWPLSLALGMTGGLIGLGLSILRPPVYQAAAVIAISMDYARVEPLEEILEDRALDRIWQLMTSDDVLQSVAAELEAGQAPEDVWASVASLRQHLRLEPRLSAWELAAVHPIPEVAALIANTWAEVALEQLDLAYAHAWNAVSLQGGEFELSCLGEIEAPSPESAVLCLAHGPDLEPAELERLVSEIEASRGILPLISYELTRVAQAPELPVLWSRSSLVAAGSLSGLILSIPAGTILRRRQGGPGETVES